MRPLKCTVDVRVVIVMSPQSTTISGGLPIFTLRIVQYYTLPPEASTEMLDSNLSPLHQKSGALQMSHHISYKLCTVPHLLSSHGRAFKWTVSRDFGGLKMILMDRIGVPDVPLKVDFFHKVFKFKVLSRLSFH